LAKYSPLLLLLAGKYPSTGFSPEDWSLLFSEARQAGVLARLAYLVRDSDMYWRDIPDCFRHHVAAAITHAESFCTDVHRELDHLRTALADLASPVLILKGAAYIRLGRKAGMGRIFNDVDILVERARIGQAEAALMMRGWSTGQIDPYDHRYYREWSHEIPPMTHWRRGTTLDLHHSLLMPTCRVKVNVEQMIRDAIPVEGCSFWWRLRDEDSLLHAACHLMMNSEFKRGLRDLWDIDLLYRELAGSTFDFPEKISARARTVGLSSLLATALGLARSYFGTPVPDYLLRDVSPILSRLVGCSASVRHHNTRPEGQSLADFLLMLRELYLRLPSGLLAVHLVHKLGGLFESEKRKAAV
jgi:Uncharacterised nucleotidyltransferase